MKKSGKNTTQTKEKNPLHPHSIIGSCGYTQLSSYDEIELALNGTLEIFADDIFCLYDRAENINQEDKFLDELGKIFAEIIKGTGDQAKREKVIMKIERAISTLRDKKPEEVEV